MDMDNNRAHFFSSPFLYFPPVLFIACSRVVQVHHRAPVQTKVPMTSVLLIPCCVLLGAGLVHCTLLEKMLLFSSRLATGTFPDLTHWSPN